MDKHYHCQNLHIPDIGYMYRPIASYHAPVSISIKRNC